MLERHTKAPPLKPSKLDETRPAGEPVPPKERPTHILHAEAHMSATRCTFVVPWCPTQHMIDNPNLMPLCVAHPAVHADGCCMACGVRVP